MQKVQVLLACKAKAASGWRAADEASPAPA